jgi:hypothetical protein
MAKPRGRPKKAPSEAAVATCRTSTSTSTPTKDKNKKAVQKPNFPIKLSPALIKQLKVENNIRECSIPLVRTPVKDGKSVVGETVGVVGLPVRKVKAFSIPQKNRAKKSPTDTNHGKTTATRSPTLRSRKSESKGTGGNSCGASNSPPEPGKSYCVVCSARFDRLELESKDITILN